MPYSQASDGHSDVFCDEKHAIRGIFQRSIRLHDGLVGALAPDGDVFRHDNATLSVNGLSHLDDSTGLSTGVVNTGLDGGETTTLCADCISSRLF